MSESTEPTASSSQLSPTDQLSSDAAERAREASEQASLPYTWSQQLDHVNVSLLLPSGTRGKDLDVKLLAKKIKISWKKKPASASDAVILEGDLPSEIRPDESTWSLESDSSQTLLVLYLDKTPSTRSTWWPHVLTHHPKIDTTKIVPENSKLSDLDGETRAVVEKMMWEQREKEKGKGLQEQKQREILKNFQAQHPEMIFSQAKIGGGGGGMDNFEFGQ